MKGILFDLPSRAQALSLKTKYFASHSHLITQTKTFRPFTCTRSVLASEGEQSIDFDLRGFGHHLSNFGHCVQLIVAFEHTKPLSFISLDIICSYPLARDSRHSLSTIEENFEFGSVHISLLPSLTDISLSFPRICASEGDLLVDCRICVDLGFPFEQLSACNWPLHFADNHKVKGFLDVFDGRHTQVLADVHSPESTDSCSFVAIFGSEHSNARLSSKELFECAIPGNAKVRTGRRKALLPSHPKPADTTRSAERLPFLDSTNGPFCP